MTEIDSILGLAEVGVILGTFMFGLCTVQTYTYYMNYPNDSLMLKSFVGTVWILGLTLTVLVCQSLYWQTITMFGNEQVVIHTLQKTLGVQLLISVILTGSIQGYFAERVRELSGRWVIPTICWVFAILRFIGFTALAVVSFGISDSAVFKRKWSWLLTTLWAISAFVDTLITGSLCFDLWPRRHRGFHKTQRIVEQLITWSIQTGLVVTVSTVVTLVLFVALDNNAWNLVGFLVPKAFANFLLSSLNARGPSRSQLPTVVDVEAAQRDLAFLGQSTSRSTSNKTRPVAIEMTVSREIMEDTPSARAEFSEYKTSL